MMEQTLMVSRGRDALASAALLFVLDFSPAASLTLRALTGARAVEALSTVARPFTLNTLTGSTTHVALRSLFHGSLVLCLPFFGRRISRLQFKQVPIADSHHR
jgi:hypothetical protein